MNKKVIIFDCEFDRLTMGQALEQIESFIRVGKSGYLCTINVAILMMIRENGRLRTIVEGAQWKVADGTPLVWLSRFLKTPLPERVTGVDMVIPLVEIAARNKWGIYLLGGSKEVVSKVNRKIIDVVEGANICGYSDGYFDEQNAAEIADSIKQSGARILIIAMGAPRQEIFIEQHLDRTGVNFAIGVGGSFDVIAGVTKRAPIWMQNSGCEWMYRSIQEPSRLLGRYIKTNSKFIVLLTKSIVSNFLRKVWASR